MCICIHCHYVDSCTTYYAVEQQHQQPHLTESPTFEATQPQINVNIRKGGTEMEWDVVGCESFTSEPHKWARLRPLEAVPT
ncbi:MAG: Ycf34 family protein [Cyanophyceae cyanobacterium]